MAETLLDIVQTILSDMDGDMVNSITDTEEAEQVARIVIETYKAMMSNTTWPHTRRALTLVPRSDSDYPTYVSFNESLKELISINYNKAKLGDARRLYQPVKYKDPDDFLRILNCRDNTQSNIDIIEDDSGIELLIQNDKAPEYYTSFDDVYIILDSYDNEVDSTIQASKIQAQGYIIPDFPLDDASIPDIPVDALSALKEESKAVCQYRIRQFQDVKAEQESARQKRWLSRKAWRANANRRYPDYGRKC